MSKINDIKNALSAISLDILNNKDPINISQIKEAYKQFECQNFLKKELNFYIVHQNTLAPYEDINLPSINHFKKKFLTSSRLFRPYIRNTYCNCCNRFRCNIIEKHFTLDKNLAGPDHSASIEPKELEYFS